MKFRIKTLLKKGSVTFISSVLPVIVSVYIVLEVAGLEIVGLATIAVSIAIVGYILSFIARRWLISLLQCIAKAAMKAIIAFIRPSVNQVTISDDVNSPSCSGSSHTFFITGANRGIGLAMTQQLLQRGHRVIASVRSREHIPVIKASVATSLFKCLEIVELDLACDAEIRQAAKQLKGQAIDCLIHNGVVGPERQSLEQLDIANVERAFAVNSIAPLSLTQALLPNLRAGKAKKIVAISSDLASAGRTNPCLLYAYQASKAALNQVVILLAKEWCYEGFTCFAIHPGSVSTRLNPSGHVTPDQSASDIIDCIAQATPTLNGQWIDTDNETVPW